MRKIRKYRDSNKKSVEKKMDFKFQENSPLLDSNHKNFLHAQTLGKKRQNEHCLALDSALPEDFYNFACLYNGLGHEGGSFKGYPFLEKISQNALISAGVETLADEMTRKFIYLHHTKGIEEDNIASQEKIEALNTDLKKYAVQDIFRQAVERIGYFGGCLVFIDNGTAKNLLHTPLILDKSTFKINSLKALRLIDPINCTPGSYNSTDPLKEDYFVPRTWWVQGQEVHASRFLYFVGKEAPLLYKPSYNFFGVPIAQLAWDYVVHLTQSREAAARLLTKFSLTAIKTNMSGALAGDGTASLDARLSYFVEKQNNNGIFAIDKEQEDLMKLDTSLSGCTEIVGQALELLATIFRIPAVKLLGISPSGFNASGESDIHNFYDYCSSMQIKYLDVNMYNLLKILQLNRYAEIDENLAFSWLPLGEKEQKMQVEIDKIRSDTVLSQFDKGIITKEEAIKSLEYKM